MELMGSGRVLFGVMIKSTKRSDDGYGCTQFQQFFSSANDHMGINSRIIQTVSWDRFREFTEVEAKFSVTVNHSAMLSVLAFSSSPQSDDTLRVYKKYPDVWIPPGPLVTCTLRL